MSLLDAACIKTDDGTIHVAPNGVIGLPGLLTSDIPAVDVVDIAVEDGKEASKRVTAARVAAVGIFALAIKKKVDATKYILIETTDNMHVFEINAKRYREALAFVKRAKVAVARGQAAAAEKVEEPTPASEPPAPAVAVAVDGEPAKRRWWETTVGDLINDRRARKGKQPIDFTAA